VHLANLTPNTTAFDDVDLAESRFSSLTRPDIFPERSVQFSETLYGYRSPTFVRCRTFCRPGATYFMRGLV
jgi:hypothetical protein